MRVPVFVVAVALVAAAAQLRAAQGPAGPAPADLELTVARFFETAGQYAQTFEETKVIEELDQSGRVKKRREIVADLAVYRTARNGDDGGATEFRDARVVDGKAVAPRGKRALDLITRAMTRGSLEEELRLIKEEGKRYDINRHVGGFTIGQTPRSTMRDDFRFHWVGPAQLNGHDVIELEYRRVVPRAQYGIERVYKGMGITSYVERGHLWYENQKSKAKKGFALVARMTFTYGSDSSGSQRTRRWQRRLDTERVILRHQRRASQLDPQGDKTPFAAAELGKRFVPASCIELIFRRRYEELQPRGSSQAC